MPVINSERYEIDPKPIGGGGFGEVYSARDLLRDEEVVVKTIVASQLYGIHEPDIRRKFFREAVLSARLGRQSPFIVEVFDYGYDRDTDTPFFVMEFVRGESLESWVGALELDEAVFLLVNLLTALETVHEAGVVHSDVSPDNIIWEAASETYKLNDFGLARILSSQLMSRGRTNSLVGGKPGYLPPSDWQTGHRTSHSDLYGLAATVVHLVTGTLPEWTRDGNTLTLASFHTEISDRPAPVIRFPRVQDRRQRFVALRQISSDDAFTLDSHELAVLLYDTLTHDSLTAVDLLAWLGDLAQPVRTIKKKK